MSRTGLATLAGTALIAAVVLLRLDVSPVPTWFYVFAWYPTLLLFDCLVVRLGGESLLARPRALLAMLWWSAVIWFGFELLNFRLQNWYYVFVPDARAERWIGITLSFASVVPAILLPVRALEQLNVWRDLSSRPVALRPRDLSLAFALGAATLAATLVAPRVLYPLTWGAVWLMAEPLLYRIDPAHSLFGDLAAGRLGRIARLMAGGLVAGALWEAFNASARAKWIYTVPFLENWRVFEMPPLGFLGFPCFALEAWSLSHLLAARTRLATVTPSVVFAVLVLVGMERGTISSTTPRLAELPGVAADTRRRLATAGLADVFRLARLEPAALAYRADVSLREAGAAHAAARLVVLRGIGTRHAAALVAGGVGSVEALAAAEPEAVWRMAHGGGRSRGGVKGGGARPTRAEVRGWLRAAAAGR